MGFFYQAQYGAKNSGKNLKKQDMPGKGFICGRKTEGYLVFVEQIPHTLVRTGD
jgi:hypothetical protein